MNALATEATDYVAKENISQLTFPKEDVLVDEIAKIERKKRVERAMRLGNTRKSKVRIIFEDVEGKKTVETTIWGVTEKNIILKQTTIIPIRRIHEIKFF